MEPRRPSRPIVSHIIMEGDSLLDRGISYKRLVGDIIPMKFLSGLWGRSPDGRFTNGYPCSDRIIAQFATDFTIRELKDGKRMTNDYIVDTIIVNKYFDHKINQGCWHKKTRDSIIDSMPTRDKRLYAALHDRFDLKNPEFVKFKASIFAITECEGGLSSRSFANECSGDVKIDSSRHILPCLAQKTERLLQYNKQHNVSKEQISKSLLIELSGANDLVTLDTAVKMENAKLAVEARKQNIQTLNAAGYKYFIIIGLPDLSLVPRFQAKSREEQDHVHKVCMSFNRRCKALQSDDPDCLIKVLDINTIFTEIYEHPEKYGFDKDKLKIPFDDSVDFKKSKMKNGARPAKGYMFRDDVHPSADMHAILAEYLYTVIREWFNVVAPTSEIPHPGPSDTNANPKGSCFNFFACKSAIKPSREKRWAKDDMNLHYEEYEDGNTLHVRLKK